MGLTADAHEIAKSVVFLDPDGPKNKKPEPAVFANSGLIN
jgi:hypothetical protein